MTISNTEISLIVVQAMLRESEESQRKAEESLSPLYTHYAGKVAAHSETVRYLEKVVAGEKANKIPLAESLALMQKGE